MQLALPEIAAGMAGFPGLLQQFEQALLLVREGAEDGGAVHGCEFA